MKAFNGRLAVVTGGGTGMGRELVVQLAAEGCHVAMCDVNAGNMAETQRLAEAGAPAGTRVSAHPADVSDEAQVLAFRDAALAAHEASCIHLLFNNAGIAGGGSFVVGDRAEWERTFGVCWYGVYYTTRAFLPALVAADEGYLVNTSSVNGFFASIGPGVPHTAYSAAKFAVKGFTEALMADLATHAPHVRAAVVMPGHIGTSIVENTGEVLGRRPEDATAEDIAHIRERWLALGRPVSNLSDDEIRVALKQQAADFRDRAPCSAARAAGIILEGVRQNRWRILVGDDAQFMDEAVRSDPENAYTAEFWQRLQTAGHLRTLTESVE